MGIKQIPLKVWIAFLEAQNCEFKRKGKGDHQVWNKKHELPQLSRPLIFRIQYKNIPAFHIGTNLKTLGITNVEFEKMIELKPIPSFEEFKSIDESNESRFKIIYDQADERLTAHYDGESKKEAVASFFRDNPSCVIVYIEQLS